MNRTEHLNRRVESLYKVYCWTSWYVTDCGQSMARVGVMYHSIHAHLLYINTILDLKKCLHTKVHRNKKIRISTGIIKNPGTRKIYHGALNNISSVEYDGLICFRNEILISSDQFNIDLVYNII